MFKKLLALALIALLTNVAASVVYASSQDDQVARRIEKIKQGVCKLGTGVEARVEVKLQDGRKLKGYIRETTDDSFTVVEKTGTATTIAYADVLQLKGQNGLTAAKVGINVVKGVAVVAVVAAIFTLFGYLIIPRT